MVSNPRSPADTRRIRRLNTPRVLEVETSAAGTPLRLRLNGGWHDVTLLRRPWRIDQHWWRGEPVRRDYYRVAPENSPPLTLYHDLVTDEWARQEYS